MFRCYTHTFTYTHTYLHTLVNYIRDITVIIELFIILLFELLSICWFQVCFLCHLYINFFLPTWTCLAFSLASFHNQFDASEPSKLTVAWNGILIKEGKHALVQETNTTEKILHWRWQYFLTLFLDPWDELLLSSSIIPWAWAWCRSFCFIAFFLL